LQLRQNTRLSERTLAHVEKKRRGPVRYADQLRSQIASLLPNKRIFDNLPRHGNAKWSYLSFVTLGILWAWSDLRCLTDAFGEAFRQCQLLLPANALPATYQGFMNALVRHHSHLLPVVRQELQRRILALRSRSDDGEWVPIAFDGSRSDAPRTVSNEAAFCAKNFGNGSTARYRKKKSKGMRRTRNRQNPPQPPKPQVWITMLWHVGLRLPWSWRLGPSDSSERDHVLTLLDDEEFPANTLFCGDAGFVGFDFWSRIRERGHHFLVRVGNNVHLLSDESFSKPDADGRVTCWPRAARAAGRPPLRLRLVRVRIGKTDMWLLTSVLDRRRLSGLRLRRLYQRRWGVEVEFRGLKQTLDRAKLRCRTAVRLQAELDWSILGLMAAELLASRAQQKEGVDPSRRSLSQTMRTLRGAMRQLASVAPRGASVEAGLRGARIDDYERRHPKRARYRPKNPDKRKLGPPRITPLTTATQKNTLKKKE
jgi:hypothetical protein